MKLPHTDVETFGCFQSFIYTGEVYDKRGGKDIPDYKVLLSVWKLATHLRMAPLRVAVLNSMAERREKTNYIPNTPLLMQAWRETEEGSGLRLMLVGWAAEHMRASPEIRSEFAKSLPQEILSELVIVMSDLPSVSPQLPQHPVLPRPGAAVVYTSPYGNPTTANEPVERPKSTKRARKSEINTADGDEPFEIKPPVKKTARKSEPIRRLTAPTNRRSTGSGLASSSSSAAAEPLSPEKELQFCADLIQRMLSGPGYWTRLVGPFKNAVDPILDNVPNYFSVVKKPMDLKSIKSKMDKGEYTSAAEFESDVRLIFQNCYEYWQKGDKIWDECEAFERYFNEKWGARNRWTGAAEGKGVKAEVMD